jgi:DnaK suppressor protein
MTKTELNTFRRNLDDRLAELGNGNWNREALAIETSPDELDRIQHASDREWAMRSLERNSSLSREARAALRRMDAGTFGICVGCEKNINPQRLAAVPWTSFCIVWQEAEDRGQNTPQSLVDTALIMAA